MMADNKDELYVGIKDPSEIRRGLLESSRGILRLLQRYERFKSIRQEKDELFSRLKRLTHEIHELDGKLKTALPKRAVKLSKKTSEVVKKEPLVSEAPKSKKKGKKKDTELEKIESSLDEIEEKLKSLA